MSETKLIGSDHVIVQHDRLVVVSRAYMEGWQVRSYRPTLIRFGDRAWRIAETRVVPPDATQYTLVPWDLSEQDVVGRMVEYGPAYVAERDRDLIEAKKSSRVTGMLRVVAPFTGFLSGRVKDRLEVLYGIDPVASTKQSVIMQFLAVTVAVPVFQIGLVVPPKLAMPFMVVLMLLLLDAAVRWGRAIGEDRPPPGFFEWALRIKLF